MAAKVIKQFSETRRNIIRGTIAATSRGILGNEKIDIIRDNKIETDMVAAAKILEAPAGLRKRRISNLVDADLIPVHRLKPKTAPLEAAYACGFVNAWKTESSRAVDTVALLSYLALVPVKDALTALLASTKSWGSSTYLSKKLTYAKEFFDKDAEATAIIDEIDLITKHKNKPNIQFYSLEVIKDGISLFSVARRHINILQKIAKGDFRKALSLNGLVATPVDEADCAGYLLRAVETSLIDTIHAIWVILNLRDRLPGVTKTLETHLDGDLLSQLLQAQAAIASERPPLLNPPSEGLSHTDLSENGNDDEENNTSLPLYRRSAVFLEFPTLCSFRNDIDKVVGYRLVAPLLPDINQWPAPSFQNKAILRSPSGRFDISLSAPSTKWPRRSWVQRAHRIHLASPPPLRLLPNLRLMDTTSAHGHGYLRRVHPAWP